MTNEYKTIGMNACIEKIGKAFVEAHRESASFSTQETDNELFCFLGIDLHHFDRKLCLSNENDWDIYASCFVRNGIAEFGDCKLA